MNIHVPKQTVSKNNRRRDSQNNVIIRTENLYRSVQAKVINSNESFPTIFWELSRRQWFRDQGKTTTKVCRWLRRRRLNSLLRGAQDVGEHRFADVLLYHHAGSDCSTLSQDWPLRGASRHSSERRRCCGLYEMSGRRGAACTD